MMSAMEKKRLPCFSSSKPCLRPRLFFFGDAGEAEGLAGEAAAEDVVRGDVGDGDGVDVAVRLLAEIRLVGLLAEFVVVGGEDASAARFFEGDAEAADAAEEIDEARRGGAVIRRIFLYPC
jgi:hypothetical protein